MGNHLAPASSRHPQPSPDPAANNGGHSSSASSSNVDVDGDGDDVDVDVPALPQDVLFDILLRLPARQLCRLHAVCRSWRSVLSDPLFVAAHAGHHPDLLVAAADADLLDDASSSGRRRVVMRVTSRATLPSRLRYYPQHYMRAHLGRVLVVGADNRPCVLNPDTGADSLLPYHVDHGERDTFFVLGWAATLGEGGYKVLSVTRGPGCDVQVCKVLTLGGGVWREAPSTPVDVKTEPWAATVANNGVVYILAIFRRIRADWIAAFDLRTERWRRGLIRGPPSNALSSLTETGGRLVAVSGSFSYASAVHLWRLTGRSDDGDAVWHKMCTVHVSRIIQRGVHERVQIARPLWVLDGGRIAFQVWSPVRLLGSLLLAGAAGDKNWVLRIYDPTTKGFEDVARMSSYMDVAIGVYSANNLRRTHGVH